MSTIELNVEGMSCGHCEKAVTKALLALDPQAKVVIDRSQNKVEVDSGQSREALAKGGPRNTIGTIAMARTNAPHSATAQFFINVVDNGFLDPSPQQPGYTVFGKVVSGMEVVNRIRATPTSSGGRFGSDVPRNPIVIQSAVML